jgi:hypothetical protein
MSCRPTEGSRLYKASSSASSTASARRPTGSPGEPAELWLFQQAVDDLLLEGDRVVGAVTQIGLRFRHGRWC